MNVASIGSGGAWSDHSGGWLQPEALIGWFATRIGKGSVVREGVCRDSEGRRRLRAKEAPLLNGAHIGTTPLCPSVSVSGLCGSFPAAKRSDSGSANRRIGGKA